MIERGQVWEFGAAYTVLTLRPRPDLNARYLKLEWSKGCYWDVLILRNCDSPEQDGTLDWCGIEEDDRDWERLS